MFANLSYEYQQIYNNASVHDGMNNITYFNCKTIKYYKLNFKDMLKYANILYNNAYVGMFDWL